MSPTGYDELNYIITLEKEIDQLEKEVKKYKRLSLIDNLTGLWNERKLKKDLKRYISIQYRDKINFTIALLDINNFKKINDKYGHEYGNKILKKVGAILKNSIRQYENVYRLGSGADEFIIILSHSHYPKLAIDRILKKLKSKKIYVSVGYDLLGKDLKCTLRKIDKRMYYNKKESYEKRKK